MTTVVGAKYTLKDARRKREPMEYALTITRAAKATNMPVFNQITLIYNGVDLEFRRDLSKSTKDATMNSCLQELEDYKEI